MNGEPLRQDDYLTFVRWHTTSGDIDPAYPVLRCLIDNLCDSDDEAVSFVFLYVAFYDLASAIETWLDGWRPGRELSTEQLKRPTGVERRAHRSPAKLAEHLLGVALSRRRAQWADWRQTVIGGCSPEVAWSRSQNWLRSFHGNGRWAAYKMGEILVAVLDWPMRPTDAGHDFSSGPRKGLADLWPHLASLTGSDPTTVRALDDYTERLVRLTGIPVEQVETTLCDWHSTLKGGYYVGHDIDLMLGQAHRSDRSRRLLLQARRGAFDDRWLGEVSGWSGVRPTLKRLYVDHGEIEWWS